MENAYGIGITNRYSCFLDNEDDPVETLKATEVDKEAKKKGKIAEKENRGKDSGDAPSNQKTGSVAVPNPTAPRKGIRDSNKGGNEANKQNNKITNNGVVGRPARGPRPAGPGQDPKNVKFNDEDREDRNNRRNLNRDDTAREGRQDGEFNRGGPRRPGGQFRPRGPLAGRPRGPTGAGGPTGGAVRKREFDRQSGSDKSGVKPVDKREGAGSRNWGTYKDDIDDVSATATPDETMDEKNDSQEITETGDAGEEKTTEQNENVEPDLEAGPKLMTLDEWKALQQPRQKPVFNVRKAGEGEDQTQWKKMILKKKEKEEQSGDEEEYEEVEDYDCPQRAGRQKQILEIDFHFTDSRRGGAGGRGGRGGRGGGSERGGGGGGERGGERERGGGGGGERGGGPAAGPPGGTGAVGARDRGPPRAPRAAGTTGGNQSAPGGGYRSNRTSRFGNRYEAPRLQTAPKVDDVNDFPSLG